MFTTTGLIIYDPNRGQMKRKTSWWCVAMVDREITRYFRWWIKKEYHLELHQPAWDAHVSIIRGEKPVSDKIDLWKKYNREKVDIEVYFNPHPNEDGQFWTVDVHSDKLMKIREEFGFPTNWSLHLTFGRLYSVVNNKYLLNKLRSYRHDRI